MEDTVPPAKRPKLSEEPTANVSEESEEKLTHYTREEEVGITQYISDHPAIFAILKHRYSDFIVHELALDGGLVQLSSFDLPPEPAPPASVDLGSVFTAHDIDQLRSLSENSKEGAPLEVTISLDEGVSKEARKSMHRAIREHFPGLESKTEDGASGGKKIIVQCGNTAKQGPSASRRWPQERGDHCQFVLYKENKDTMEAVSQISRTLKIKSSNFHYAGTKDRRAVTSQLLTAFRVSAEKLVTLNSSKFCRNIFVGNFRYVSEQMRLGDLTGNRFSIVLRKVSCEDDEVIKASLSSLRDNGFVNYFGMQRFGTSVVPTHHIGRCLVHSDWEGAIEMILKPRHGDSEEVNAAREYYHSTKDATGALKRMPRWKGIEWQLLRGLETHGEKNNFLGALNFIPRNTRLMYVHSWQSYVWNKVVSWRLQVHGRTPIPGDLVYREKTIGNHNSKAEVDVITRERLSEYTIHDVLLPLPGFDVKWPENEAKEEMMKLLSEDKITLDMLQHRVKDFSLTGSYRHIVSKPTDVTWEIAMYEDSTEPLFATDMDIMSSKPPPTSITSIPGGKYKGLKVEFNLPSSTYATMALREVLKMDTSSAHQSTLNDE